MFDPMELERARIRSEILKQQATEADAQHKILEGSMRLQSLTPAISMPGTGSSGLSWALLVVVIVAAAIGFGAASADTPHRAATHYAR